jgi:hypothetical protein
MAPALRSPLARPTAIAEPGTSVWGGKASRRGEAGALTSVRPCRAAARVNTVPTAGDRPPRLIGAARVRARRIVCGRRLTGTAGSTGSPRTSSIGVARAVKPPYSPIASEIAPAIRPPHVIGDPEKPGPRPVRSIATPDARKRMRGASAPRSPAMTSRTCTSNVLTAVPATTERAVHAIPGRTSPSGMTGSPAAWAGPADRSTSATARMGRAQRMAGAAA